VVDALEKVGELVSDGIVDSCVREVGSPAEVYELAVEAGLVGCAVIAPRPLGLLAGLDVGGEEEDEE